MVGIFGLAFTSDSPLPPLAKAYSIDKRETVLSKSVTSSLFRDAFMFFFLEICSKQFPAKTHLLLLLLQSANQTTPPSPPTVDHRVFV